MKSDVAIFDNTLEVEFDFKITAHGSLGCGPSLSYPGDPPEAAEFDIEIIELRFPKQHSDVHLDIPQWLNDLLVAHLYERDDVNEIVQQADQDPYDGYDPDYERDARDER